MEHNPFLWYRDKDNLRIGDVRRYNISYVAKDKTKNEIYLRLKNIEKVPIRAIHLLNGPFIVYCHVVPYSYKQSEGFKVDNLQNLEEVQFENQIKPGQTFNVTLYLNSNSFKEHSEDGFPIYSWSIDIISQIYINRKASVHYDLMIGSNIDDMKSLNKGPISNTFISLGKESSTNLKDSNTHLGRSKNLQLTITKDLTEDLWSLEPKYPDKPIHLVILTHGIFSNLTADMLYVRDALTSNSDDNLIVTGYNGNAGKTERGVKKLGIACSSYIIFTIEELKKKYKIDKISFVGHSLGGLVQLYSIKHILQTEGTDYFSSRKIMPENLVCLASPLLGVLSEFNFMISLFLDIGSLGKTGRDLTLSRKFPNLKGVARHEILRKRDTLKPLLETLPDDPLQNFLGQFKNLTLYANAINDGIVPLRTSALLYLDYEALGDVNAIKNRHDVPKHEEEDDHSIKTTDTIETVGEISESNGLNDKSNTPEDYSNFMSLNLNTDNEQSATGNIGSRGLETDQSSVTTSTAPKDPFKNGSMPTVTSSSSTKSDMKKIDFTNLRGNFSRRKRINRLKKVRRINAKGSKLHQVSSGVSTPSLESDANAMDKDNGNANGDADSDTHSARSVKLPPKASAIESAIYTLICPVPNNDFITEPTSRRPVIFHDRYYHFRNLPFAHEEEPDHKISSFGSAIFRNNEWKLNKQVKIAKKYHSPKMNWRKVLVNLPPDAHNNIIVRRRFANAYGWGVVDHLCNEVFSRHNGPEVSTSLIPSNIDSDKGDNETGHTMLKPKI